MSKKTALTKEQAQRARILRGEIGKARAWITGYEAGSSNTVLAADSLRQVQLLLDELLRAAAIRGDGQ